MSFDTTQPVNAMVGEMPRGPRRHEGDLLEAGRIAGRREATPNPPKTLVDAYTEIQVERIRRQEAVKLPPLQAELEALGKRMEFQDAARERHRHDHEALADQYAAHPSRFSPLLGLVLVALSVLLLLSDVPLSLLVAKGLEITNNQADVPLSELLADPWAVLVAHWETLVLGLGVAALTLVLKVLHEDVVAPPEVLRERQHGKGGRGQRWFIGLVTLVALGAIITLGVFRADVHADQVQADLRSAGQGTSAATAEPVSMGGWAKAAFILISVALPGVGAVFFAAGWSKWSRCWLRRHSRQRYAQASRDYLGTVEQHSRCQREIERIDAYLNGPTLAAERDAFREQGTTVFHQGYEEGVRELRAACGGKTLYDVLNQRGQERLHYGRFLAPLREETIQ